ncbi:MAG: 5'-3' exonuclease H3TH domain-containing protein [Microgenomates group bacterium]
MSHLVIIDGHAIAHRAYHSIPPLSVNGQPVNALYGFYSMILSALDTLHPDYLIVCLDSAGPNFRNDEFVGYRAQRKPADLDLKTQLPLLPQTLDSAGITNFAMGGFEADDLIGTIAVRSLRKIRNKEKFISRVTIITGDKDLMQLVNDKVSLFVPVQGLSVTKLYGPDEVKEKLGVNPSQVVDLKALMGDSSDNYPGVEGIGPVAAINLLSSYQHLDNIYSNLDKIKPTISQRLLKDRDNAYLSQKLATIVTNIPLKFKLSTSRLRRSTYLSLEKLFIEYNFKSLLTRLHSKNPDVFKKAEVKVKSTQASLF